MAEIKEVPFTTMNPNGRVPVLEDPNTNVTTWETGSCIEYLIEVYDKASTLSHITSPQKYQLKSWLFFQTSGQGPYYGQAAWFLMFHHEPLPSAQQRYVAEVKRVLGVLDSHLAKSESGWLVGDKITYADLEFVMWNGAVDLIMDKAGEKDVTKAFPHYEKWNAGMMGRESVKKIMRQSMEAQMKAYSEGGGKNANWEVIDDVYRAFRERISVALKCCPRVFLITRLINVIGVRE